MTRTSSDAPRMSQRWYVIHTRPRQELRAARNLNAWGIETFFPKVTRADEFAALGTRTGTDPLFPRYIFGLFSAEDCYRVSYTRGIERVVCFGGKPVAVDNEVGALAALRADDPDRPSERVEFKPGDQLKIVRGPMKDLVGIFERDVSASERVRILLTAIGHATHVELNRTAVARFFPSPPPKVLRVPGPI